VPTHIAFFPQCIAALQTFSGFIKFSVIASWTKRKHFPASFKNFAYLYIGRLLITKYKKNRLAAVFFSNAWLASFLAAVDLRNLRQNLGTVVSQELAN